jgi:hypothetical protein
MASFPVRFSLETSGMLLWEKTNAKRQLHGGQPFLDPLAWLCLGGPVIWARGGKTTLPEWVSIRPIIVAYCHCLSRCCLFSFLESLLLIFIAWWRSHYSLRSLCLFLLLGWRSPYSLRSLCLFFLLGWRSSLLVTIIVLIFIAWLRSHYSIQSFIQHMTSEESHSTWSLISYNNKYWCD